ncbi:MAG: FAD-dependent oxidoreductase [Betaproteobacteria bacterium]|nr:FAD-dependent oxidoreductase [Betaproteobacteria bacterium]MDH3435698.1 FAD-dependent oxidoreductase [Betaproteobacteria bacterium]
MERLLLLGGGHSHVEVIRRFGARPLRGTAITLVSPDRHTPYSGMLPGFVAGHYDYDDCHIDLEPLCAAAGILLHRAEASAFDPDAGRVVCSDGSVAAYDVLSIDVGSTPDMRAIPGALEHGIPVKPVAQFLSAWENIHAALRDGRRLSLAFVGGGAGAVELAAAMHHRLVAEVSAAAGRISLLTDAASILPTHPARVQRIFERLLRERGIEVRFGAKVVGISPGRVECADGSSLSADHAIIATGAGAPGWITESGLRPDARGFIAVNGHLQSLSHPNVFAAGDIATMVDNPRPKMGVYAVRQGPILDGNLRRALRGEALRRYLPQRTALTLISTGGKHAVASWNGIVFEGDWVWHWKDRIDCRFMARYRRESA